MRGGGWKRDLKTLYARAKYRLSKKDILEGLMDYFQGIQLDQWRLPDFLRVQEEDHQREMSQYNETIARNNASIKELNASLEKLKGYQFLGPGKDMYNRNKDMRDSIQDQTVELKKEMNLEIKRFEIMKKAARQFVNIPRVEGTIVEQPDIDIPEGEAIPQLTPQQMPQATSQAIPVLQAYRGAEEVDPEMLRAMAESERMRDEERQRSGRGLSRGKNVGIMRRIVLFR